MTVRLPRKERIKQITNITIIITIIEVNYNYNRNVPEFHEAKKIKLCNFANFIPRTVADLSKITFAIKYIYLNPRLMTS